MEKAEIKMIKYLDFLKYNYDVNLMMIIDGAHEGDHLWKTSVTRAGVGVCTEVS